MKFKYKMKSTVHNNCTKSEIKRTRFKILCFVTIDFIYPTLHYIKKLYTEAFAIKKARKYFQDFY